ncbi:MAG TPA: hypothetical protein VFO41_00790 [Alphaproteobacteria bacterium]|nr:hypothetical protein [Alphaproteobacteria bacterium]
MTSAEPLRRLALMTAGNPRFALNSISVDPSGGLELTIPPRPSKWCFGYDGLTYAVALEPGETRSTITIRARVGEVPYTAESIPARLAVLTILRHSRDLATARFDVDRHQAIWLSATTVLDDPLTPEAVIVEILRLIQEARPYLRVLKEAA